MRICAATGNAGKLRELRRILEAQGHEVVSQKELGITIEPDETGTTFEANALIKAETICKASGLPTIADDSGLCVDALDGAPGVYVNGAKVAALGIRVRRGCSFHGLAFNIAGESVAPFLRINPCGYQGLEVVAMGDLGGPAALDAVKPVLLDELGAQFGLALGRAPALPAQLVV